MPLIWNERSFASVVAGVSLKELQVQQTMPSFEKKENIIPVQLETTLQIIQEEDLNDDIEEEQKIDEQQAEEVVCDEDAEYEFDDAEDQSFDFYESFESQFTARRTTAPRKPITRISSVTRRNLVSNLSTLSHACTAKLACKLKQLPADRPQFRSTYKVQSPYGRDDLMRQEINRWLEAGKNQSRMIEDAFKRSLTASAESTKQSSPQPTPAPLSKSQLRSFSQRLRHTPAHLRTICEEGNSRWAKVLNHRLLVKSLIRERKAFQSRREQCNTSFSKQTSAVVKHCRRREEKAKTMQRHRQNDMHAARRAMMALHTPPPAGNHKPASKKSHSRTVHSSRKQTVSICSVPRPTLSHASSSLTRRSTRLIGSQFDNFRRQFFFRNREKIEKCFEHDQYNVAQSVTLADINPAVAKSFMCKRASLNEDYPELTFHGTRSNNVPSILQRGFLIPNRVHADGTRIRVANGSAYGVGVYSSKSATYSAGYTQGASSIFICAVLKTQSEKESKVGVQQKNKRNQPPKQGGCVRFYGDMCVLFEESRIVPLFMLNYTTVAYGQQAPPAVSASSVKSNINWFKEQRKQMERPLKFVPVGVLRQLLHKQYATILKNNAEAKHLLL